MYLVSMPSLSQRLRTVLGLTVDALQAELIGESQGSPGRMQQATSAMIFSRTSGGVSFGKLLGIGNRSMSPSRPRSWKARLYS